MKIKSIAAAGALGLGMGFVGLIGGTATASAACGDTPIPVGERVGCLAAGYTNTFLNGTDTEVCSSDGPGGTPECHIENDGLGVDITKPNNQLKTFMDTTDPFTQVAQFQESVADFANGPRFP